MEGEAAANGAIGNQRVAPTPAVSVPIRDIGCSALSSSVFSAVWYQIVGGHHDPEHNVRPAAMVFGAKGSLRHEALFVRL